MICMNTHKHTPKLTLNIWKAGRLIGQIRVYKSKTSPRNQKGNNVNPSYEMSAVKVYSLHGSPAEMWLFLITFVSVKPVASRPTAAIQERQPLLHKNVIS